MGVDSASGRLMQPRSASSTYLMSWVAVAAFGLGYIGVASTRPELLGSILPIAESPVEHAGAARSTNDLAEEVAVLRQQVHDLQHDLAATRNALQDQLSATSGTITQRLAAAEERLPPVREAKAEPPSPPPLPPMTMTTTMAPPAPPAPPAPAKAAAQRPQAKAQPPAQPAAAPDRQPATNVRVINGSSDEMQIATGSIPEAAAKAAPVPTGPRAIEIASADSLEGLRARWGELSGRNADVLGATTPRYRLSTDGRGAPFTLLAGPYETSGDATRACTALRAKGVTCRVGAYAGNAF